MAQAKPDIAQLRHARRRLVSRPVPEMDEQPVGHKNRRRAVQGRRPSCTSARSQSGSADALRHWKFSRADRSRQCERRLRCRPTNAHRYCRTCRPWPRPVSAVIPARAGGGLRHRRARRPPSSTRSIVEFVKLFSEPNFIDVPGPSGGGAGADHTGRLRRVSERRSQSGRVVDQDREQQARGVQAAITAVRCVRTGLFGTLRGATRHYMLRRLQGSPFT